MPDKKNPIVRYMVLDSCFRNRRKRYYIDDLLEAVNNYMRVHSFQPISERQLRDDINFMEYDAAEDIELLRIQDGHSKYYQYRDPGMSMFKHQLTDDEAALISNTVKLLSRFEGLPRYDWVDETLLRLRELFQFRSAAVYGTSGVISYRSALNSWASFCAAALVVPVAEK